MCGEFFTEASQRYSTVSVKIRLDFGASHGRKFSAETPQVIKAFNLIEDFPSAVLQTCILLATGQYGDKIAIVSVLFSVRGIMFRIDIGGSSGDHQFGSAQHSEPDSGRSDGVAVSARPGLQRRYGRPCPQILDAHSNSIARRAIRTVGARRGGGRRGSPLRVRSGV